MAEITKRGQQNQMGIILASVFITFTSYGFSREMIESIDRANQFELSCSGKITYPMLAQFLFEVGAFIMAEHNKRSSSEPIE